MYVNVVVDLAVKEVDKPFAYHVPDKLKDKVEIGRRVIVPFGRQKTSGYVVSLRDRVDFKTKDIIDLNQDFIFFDQKLLKLAEWMAEYYQCYLISALKAIVPSGKVKIKTKKVVTLAQSVTETIEIIDRLSNRAKKQQAILEFLVANYEHSFEISQIEQEVNTSYSTIKTLIDKNFIKYQEEEVRRDPCAMLNFETTTTLKPTVEQKRAIGEINSAIIKDNSSTILLKGVTGSGKTEVYLQVIEQALKMGQDTIVLVPEISLTPQTIARFKGRFGEKVAILHSQLSQGERFDEWRRIDSGQVQVVVGARSAVFAPFNNLGLIIIDEEHETSYKQEDHPKYHAREVAIKRAKLNQAVVLLGTATPSLESYYRAQEGEYSLLELSTRIDQRPLPQVELIDMREELESGNKTMFSSSLEEKLIDRLKKGEQSIIFLNRRGFSTFVQCRECGHVMKCESCDVSLTYHASANILQCHYCDHKEKVPSTCPKCSSIYIKYFGVGTQKVEESLNNLLPEAKIARMDVDTTRRKGSYQRILAAFKNKEIDILVGTQMIAKGHDFHNVTLVGVITADTALNLPDFRAGERTFQLLTQVAGRTGRGQKEGKVIIQSYTPEHYSIQFAQSHDYKGFYDLEIATREVLLYPPYTHMIKITISDQVEKRVIATAEQLGGIIEEELHKIDDEEIDLLGPTQAPLSKVRGEYRWQLLLKAKNMKRLRGLNQQSLIKLKENLNFKSVKVSVDVDPLGML